MSIPPRLALAVLLLTAQIAVGTEPPVNDSFTNSVKISGFTNSIAGDLRYATAEPGEPAVSGATPSHSLWWSWTAPATGLGVVTLNTASSPVGPDVRVSIFGGTNLSQLTLVATSLPNFSYNVSKSWSVVEGETYHISVGSTLSSNTFAGGVDFRYRPANDAFTNRTLLSPMTNVVTASNTIWVTSSTANNLYGTREPGEPNVTSTGSSAGRTLWWSWSAPLSGLVSVLVSSPSLAYSRIYTGSTLEGLTTVQGTTGPGFEGASPSRTYLFRVRSGSRYEIQTDGMFVGAIDVSVSVTLVPGPENDDIANAVRLNGSVAFASGHNYGATWEVGEPFISGAGAYAQTVWWAWMAPHSQTVTVVSSNSFRSGITVFAGSQLTQLSQIASAPLRNPGDSVVFDATAGTEYRFALYGLFQNVGEIAFTLRPANMPSLSVASRLNEGISFKLSGVGGVRYRIDQSADLQNWTPFQSVTLSSNSWQFSVPVTGTSGGRFYRPVLDP